MLVLRICQIRSTGVYKAADIIYEAITVKIIKKQREYYYLT